MSSSTRLKTIKAAKKSHQCSWCAEHIGIAQTYKRYRYFSYGDAGTVKLHPECYDAMKEAHAIEGAGFEFEEGENPRGCICGHSKECSQCESRKSSEI